MVTLYEEVARRFPEIDRDIAAANRDLPYVQMAYVVEWLEHMRDADFTPEVGERIRRFVNWCEEQPRGNDAGDDLYTVLVVAFYERMFDSERTRSLLPKILSYEDIITNAEYYKSWVGAENYDKALQQYGRSV